MGSAETEAEIATLAAREAEIVTQVDECVREFAIAIVPLAQDWIRRETQRQIRKDAKQIEGMGIEKVRALKTDVQALLDKVPDLSQEALGGEKQWLHRAEPENTPDGSRSRGGDTFMFFDGIYRAVISNLGEVLAKHGLSIQRAERYPAWEGRGSGKFRYAMNTELDSAKLKPVIDFSARYRELVTLRSGLEKLKERLAQEKAQELWESA